MSKNSTIRAAEIAAMLAHALYYTPPSEIAPLVYKMQTTARLARQYAEMACNYPLTEKQIAAMDNRIAKRGTAINEKLQSWYGDKRPAVVTFGGDPRGACGYINIPGNAGEGWHGGYAIY